MKEVTWLSPILIDAPLKLLDGFNYESKGETTKGVGACSLVRNTSKVEGHAGAPRSRLQRLTSKSIIHMDLHKPNNKLVSV
jgi:hypothetical protein